MTTEEGADLPGQVRDLDGQPVPEATVFVLSAPGPTPDIAAITNADGTFVLFGLPDGDYVLKAVGPTGTSGTAIATVPGYAEITLGRDT